MSVSEIKKLLKSENLLIGSERTLKALMQGDLERVYLANNAPKQIVDDIKHYASLSKLEVVVLDVPNDELGVVCKKPFSISVIGIKRKKK